MGAGASAQEGESAAIFDQLMAKWETLALEPQYSGTGDVTKPGMSLQKPGALFVSPIFFASHTSRIAFRPPEILRDNRNFNASCGLVFRYRREPPDFLRLKSSVHIVRFLYVSIANYEELVNMGIPAAGPEQEFFLELRKHFRSIVKADVVSHHFFFHS